MVSAESGRLRLPRRHAQFGLLARVTPISTTEGTNVTTNVRNGNNLAWRNIQVVDDFSGTMAAMSMMMANDTEAPMMASLQFREVPQRYAQLGQFVEAIDVGMPAELFRRIEGQAGTHGKQAQAMQGLPEDTRVPCGCGCSRMRWTASSLKPGERFPLRLVFQMRRRSQTDEGAAAVRRRAAHGRQGARDVVGGVRFELDVSQFNLVRPRSAWRDFAQDDRRRPMDAPDYDDAKWPEAPAPLGFAPKLEAMAGVPRARRSRISASASTCRIRSCCAT